MGSTASIFSVDHWVSTTVVSEAAFMYGFIHRMLTSDMLHFPLSTALISCIVGGLCCIGAELVADLMPPKCRFMLPVAMVISLIYTRFIDIKKNDQSI